MVESVTNFSLAVVTRRLTVAVTWWGHGGAAGRGNQQRQVGQMEEEHD